MLKIKHDGLKWVIIRKGKVEGKYNTFVQARIASMTLVYKD